MKSQKEYTVSKTFLSKGLSSPTPSSLKLGELRLDRLSDWLSETGFGLELLGRS